MRKVRKIIIDVSEKTALPSNETTNQLITNNFADAGRKTDFVYVEVFPNENEQLLFYWDKQFCLVVMPYLRNYNYE